MRKINEVLRLRLELSARSARSPQHRGGLQHGGRVLRRFAEAGLSWPLPAVAADSRSAN